MARQVLPWVGAAVGFWIGGPAGAQAGFAIGGLVGNAIDPQVINGPKLGEGQDNNASEGGYRPIVLGKGAVGVCMIHEGPLKKRTIRHKQSKGGGPVTTEERAYRTMAFALGESAYPETGVQLSRLWIDNKLRYDVTPTSQIKAESAEFENEFTFYPGDNNQQPDPDLEAFLGAGNVPSYRGGSPYIVFPDWDVTDSRGMAPMIKAELASHSRGQKAYAVVHDQNRVLFSETGMEWPLNDYFNPVTNPVMATAGGGAVIVANASETKVTFNEQDFVDAVGLTGHGRAGVFCESSQLWIMPIGGAPAAYDPCIYISEDAVNYEPASASWPQYGFVGGPGVVRGSVVLFRDQGRWVWRSSDGGRTFSRARIVGLPVLAQALLATNGFFFAIMSDGSIFRSQTGADDDWVEAHPAGFAGIVGGTAHDPNRDIGVIVSDAGACFYSEPGAGEFVSGTSHGIGTVSTGADRANCAFINGWFLVAGTASSNGQIKAIYHPDDAEWLTVKEAVASGAIRAIVSGFGFRQSEKVQLSDIMLWIHERVSIGAPNIDVSQLTDQVEGIVFADGYTAADAIRTQMALYFFDAGEFDAGGGYQLNYIKRGGSASVTLTEADIVDGPEDWEREDSYERPRALHVAYQNPVADYGAPNITIKRTSPDVLVVGERSASVPNVFSDVDEITQRADIMMAVIYSEIAGTYEITLPVSWLELAPTDCIGFSIRGRTRRLRLTNWRFSPDGTIKTEWMADRQSAYTSNVTGLPVVPPTPPPPSIVGPTISAVLDIPALVDALDSLHIVLAASGQTEAWYGSIHQRKLPSDADFATMAQFSAPTTIMGTLQVAVSAASPHYTDTTNVVRVKLYSDDELDTYTQQQFLSEHGAFALAWEDSGTTRWEVCQYRDAVKVGDMEWELTTLLRGRLNTEAEAHPIGSLFVLLDSGIRVAPAQSSWIGQDITHRAVSNGQLPDNAVPYVEPYIGESQREWPVAHVQLGLAGDDLAVEIVPRHRFGTDDHPVRSLNWDGYRIEATDGVNSAELTSASDATTIDVTGWTGTITVTVAQLNRITGEGPTVSETINA